MKKQILGMWLALLVFLSAVYVVEVNDMSEADGITIDQDVLRRIRASIQATYTVFSSGGTTYAKSNVPGGTDYEDVDANCGSVINDALSAMSDGGILLLREGTFVIGSTGLVVAHDGTTIMGSGMGTIVQFTKATGVDDYTIKIEEKDNCRVTNFKILGQLGDGNHGIFIYGSSKFMIDHMWISGVGEESIFVLRKGTTWCRDGIIANNLIEGAGDGAIELNYGSQFITIANNVVRDCDAKGVLPGGAGIRLVGDATYTVEDNTVVGNIVEECQRGINIAGYVHDNVIADNVFTNNAGVGIRLYDGGGAGSPTYNLITGNLVKDNGSHGVYVQDASSYNDFLNNKIMDNTGYGVYVLDSTCVDNVVKGNTFSGNSTAPYLSASTTTKLACINLPLVAAHTFLSADGNSWGAEIDANTEYAIFAGSLPPHVHRVAYMIIKAVGLAAPGAGNAMNLQIDGYGGADDEAEGTETITIATKKSVTDNTAVNDYIQWLINASDDADIDDLAGGDTVQIKVQHDAAAGGDIATDAVFQTVEVYYV